MKNCPICNSNDILSDNEIKNIWNKVDNVLFCKNCELYFLEDVPNQNKIDELYKKEYHHYSQLAHFVKNIFRIFRSASQSEYIKANAKNLDGKKILEIGACDGLLLNYFKNSIVKGLEYSPVYKKIASKKYGINLLNKSFFDLDEKFDLIIMSHVIEHLPDLNSAIEKLKNLLNDGGYLFVEVPNSPRLYERDFLYINNYLTTPHIYNFTKKSLKGAFVKCNLRIVCLDRFFYNFSKYYNIKKQEKIAEIFLTGSGFKFKYTVSIFMYLIKNIFNPNKSYKKIETDLSYLGSGDNLRIILKK